MWKQDVNKLLRRATGYELARPAGHPAWRMPPPRGERLLVAPVFIFSAARSGSTLLRAILGSHSRLYAPPELPLMHMAVKADTPWIEASLKALNLTTEDLEHLLWDRVLADALRRSGKPTVVVKTPANVLIWQRIASCWPDARFFFLLRHPAASVTSLHASWNERWHPGESGTLAESAEKGLRYMLAVEEARQALPGFTIRYEELTADPEAVVRAACDFLKVDFEPDMLDYGQFASNRFAPGLGDASAKIKSGQIQPPAPPPAPEDIPAELKEICASWGYLDVPQGEAAPGAQPETAADAQAPSAASS